MSMNNIPPDTKGAQGMAATLGATLLRTLLATIGASLVTHGVLSGSNVEIFIAAGMTIGGVLWTFWTSYGRAIVMAKLEVYKATALAQAAALDRNNIPQPTPQQVADKGSPSLTAAKVVQVTTTAMLALFVIAALSAPAFAQREDSQSAKRGATSGTTTNFKLPIDPLGLNGATSSGSPLQDLMSAFDEKLKPDLEFALKIAQKSGNDQTAKCWQAWLDQIAARQNANVDANGNPLTAPDPHLITDFQKIMDLRNALQPNAPFFQACTPIAVTIKLDITKFIGIVVSGGAGLMALVPGL